MMNIQIPKNLRQIGEIHSSYKIYVEDYVATFFRQLCRRGGTEGGEILLFGHMEREEDKTCFFISGAGRKEDAASFADSDELGQAFLYREAGQRRELGENVIHQSGGTDRELLLCFIDAESEELVFENVRGNRRTAVDGYYIYYEQNETMQNYLIDWYGSHAASTERGVRDQAAKYFRSTYYSRQEEMHQRKIISLLYTASLMLLTLCCIAGISMINQYDKMKDMELAVQHLAMALEEKNLPQENIISYIPPTDGYAGENREQAETAETAPADGESSQEMAGGASGEETADAQEEPEAVEAFGGNVIAGRGNEVYIVKEGDTLARISKSFYGTTSKLTEICELNDIKDPNNIIVGQKILLP